MASNQKWSEDVRKALGDKSQRQIAFKIGVSPGTLSNMLMGRIPEDMGVVRRFAEAVGEDPEEWERKARFYSTEIYLRSEYGNITDSDLEEVRKIIEKYDD